MSVSPELLIFDCDGVLIDSEPVASRVMWQSLTKAGVSITRREVLERFTHMSESGTRRIFAGMEDFIATLFPGALRPCDRRLRAPAMA